MTELIFNPVVWLIAGIVILALEMLISGFELVGLSIGTLLTALFIWRYGEFIAAFPYPEAMILVFLAVTSVGSWFLIRAALGLRRGQDKPIKHDINEN
jgi:membrane protein implicated in regulation of membrane protease activity